jgi:hypothetical protein
MYPQRRRSGRGDSLSPDAPIGGSIDDGGDVWGSGHVRRRKADHDTTTHRQLGGKGSSAAMIYLRGSFSGPRRVRVASLEMTLGVRGVAGGAKHGHSATVFAVASNLVPLPFHDKHRSSSCSLSASLAPVASSLQLTFSS